MARVTLQSRLPSIASSIRPRVAAKVKDAAELVAEDAARRVNLGPPTEHISENIDVERAEAAAYRVAVNVADPKGISYPYVVEFGGVTQAPHPFLLPALEANQDNAVYLVTAALRGL